MDCSSCGKPQALRWKDGATGEASAQRARWVCENPRCPQVGKAA